MAEAYRKKSPSAGTVWIERQKMSRDSPGGAGSPSAGTVWIERSKALSVAQGWIVTVRRDGVD